MVHNTLIMVDTAGKSHTVEFFHRSMNGRVVIDGNTVTIHKYMTLEDAWYGLHLDFKFRKWLVK